MKKLVGWSMWAAPSLQIHPSNSSCATHHVGRSEYFKYDCIIEILLSVGRMQNQRALDFFNCFISSKVDAIMPNTRLAFTLLFAAALIILAGCTTMHYDFKAPDTDQGRYCVTQCAGIKEACNGNEIHRANSEKTSCERSNDTVHMACMGKSANKEQEKECENIGNTAGAILIQTAAMATIGCASELRRFDPSIRAVSAQCVPVE